MNRSPISPRHRMWSSAAAFAALASLALTSCAAEGSEQDEVSEDQAEGIEEAQTVEHAMGSTEIPDQPERVVVLEINLLDTAMALGVVPAGAALIVNTDELPDYLGEDVQDIASVGSITEPSLEQIADLDPDLILGAKSRHEDLYDTFSDIAPTVFVESPGGDWRSSIRTVGEALGVPDTADALLADYDERTAEVKEDMDLAGLTAQVIRPREAGAVRLYGPDTFTGDVLSDLGFEIPEQDWEDNGILEISSENVGDLAADRVFVSSDPTTPDLPDWTMDLLEGTDSEIHHVDHEVWIAGVGPLGAQEIIAEVEEILSQP
ncbi:ABC transporter substrate-binding protein [Nesterenkonia populi]|uniref:ABC transporter substrate-binding protein n=1 Tax=Nesterenkonia populi TaxID=1591087 RepID=UPI001478C573|nr:iron-siderophore ABC transporter substrate-binding protein [Nesterenkonia populi]